MNQQEGAFSETKKRPSLRNTNETRSKAASRDSISHPQGNDGFSQCKQVSRLGLILLAHLPAFAVASTRFRQLHGYWDSPELSSDSLDVLHPGGTPRIAAQIHRLFICHVLL